MTVPIVLTTMKEIRTILNKEGPSVVGLERIADMMRLLLPHSEEILGDHLRESVRPERGLNPIYVESGGITLTWGIVVPEEPTPVHSHGTWGVVAVIRGRDRYQRWRREDDGEGAGPAEVRLLEEQVLTVGDVMVLPPPPQDIHLQQGHKGETAYEFVLFGEDFLGRLPYLVFDPENGFATEIYPR
ncbi:cupin domain-containing protein [Edaphobacter albus]|uniref:hypothetical protein n=1 Tax=Edaphobacter sp. 4G125 TaxID=2763071 RepID=UPI0016459F08|nr:hypothetical protein [Edaphobacter sp. 4G125]QNI36027.1 hypothetical protein H7846_13605 [Edaphobacter sp. 4G125]